MGFLEIFICSCGPRLKGDPGWTSSFSGASVYCVACWGITDFFLDIFDNSMISLITHCSVNYEWIARNRLSVGIYRGCGSFTLSLACLDSPREKIRSCSVNCFSLTLRLAWCYICDFCSGSSFGKGPRKRLRLVEAGMGFRLSPVGWLTRSLGWHTLVYRT